MDQGFIYSKFMASYRTGKVDNSSKLKKTTVRGNTVDSFLNLAELSMKVGEPGFHGSRLCQSISRVILYYTKFLSGL